MLCLVVDLKLVHTFPFAFFMQKLNKTFASASLKPPCFADCEENEQLVVFELVVPVAAKVPALNQPVAVAKIVQPASITSTVPGQILAPLRANNTAQGTAWCITATLAATRQGPARLLPRY